MYHIHLIQILVHEIHNNLIILVYQCGFYGAGNDYGKVCVGYMSLRNQKPKNIKPTHNRNKMTCECENCIIAALLQYDLNK